MATTPTSPDWTAARALMHLDPTVTMLNTGSFGPVPRPVFDRATELRHELAMGPTDFFLRKMPPLLWHARERTAAFLGTAPQRLVFTTNVSAAINLIASSLRLASPGEILLTDHEYGASDLVLGTRRPAAGPDDPHVPAADDARRPERNLVACGSSHGDDAGKRGSSSSATSSPLPASSFPRKSCVPRPGNEAS